jgi:hypothetical protein
MPEYVIKRGDEEYTITSKVPLNEAAQRRLAQQYLGGETPTPAPETAASPKGTFDPMTGMRMPASPAETEETFKGMGEGANPAMRFGLDQALGIGLPVAGMAAGSAIGGPAGGFLGETAGSYGARKISTALGLQPPGMVGDIASIAAPGVMRGVGSLIKSGVQYLPGVGTAMQDVGVGEARNLAERLVPSPKSDVLYAQVAKMNPAMRLPETGGAANALLSKEATLPKALQSSTIRETAGALDEISGTGTDFQTLWLAQRRVRDLMRSSQGEERNALGRLDSAIWKDIDAAAASGTPDAGLLRAANKAYRQERAVDDLKNIIEGSVTESSQGLGTGTLNAGAMLKKFDAKVRNDDLFAGAFSAADQDSIRGIFKDLSNIPKAGLAAGQFHGSGFGVAAGGLTGFVTHDPAMAGLAAFMPVGLSIALGTSPGRALVRGLMRTDKLMTPEGAAALRGFLQTTGQVETGGQ